MRNVIIITVILLMAALCTFYGCKKDKETQVQGMTLVSLKSGTVNMNSDSLVRNVSTTLNIVATFSNDVDYNTIRKTTITLLRNTVGVELNFIIEGKILTISPQTELLSGSRYTLMIDDSVASTNGFKFSGTTINFFTAGIGVDTPPSSDHQILYVQFNGSISDVTLHDSVTYSNLYNYGVDRFGVANEAGNFTGGIQGVANATGGTTGVSGTIVELFALPGNSNIPPSMTLSVWLNVPFVAYRSSLTGLTKGVLGLAAERGYYLEIGARDTTLGPGSITVSTEHQLVPSGTFFNSLDQYDSSGTLPGSVSRLVADSWHQFVLTFDDSLGVKKFYIDGKLISFTSVTTPSMLQTLGALAVDTVKAVGLDTQLTLGFYCSKENTSSRFFDYATESHDFIGLMDDLRIFNIAFKEEDVLNLYSQEMAPK
jgi:hypothetical protein